MRKYHAAHRCERHRTEEYQRQEGLDECKPSRLPLFPLVSYSGLEPHPDWRKPLRRAIAEPRVSQDQRASLRSKRRARKDIMKSVLLAVASSALLAGCAVMNQWYVQPGTAAISRCHNWGWGWLGTPMAIYHHK